MSTFIDILYLLSSVCFILALKFLSDAKTSINGNYIGIVGISLAILAASCSGLISNYIAIFSAIIIGGTIGIIIARKISMTALPQLVAGFHSLVGISAVFVALSAFYAPSVFGIGVSTCIKTYSLLELSLGAAIGAITFTGSLVAFAKLQGILPAKAILLPERHLINIAIILIILLLICVFIITSSGFSLWLLIIASFSLGILGIIPIGGADMPVIISMLNSYSGWAACGIGFTLHNSLLIITGALVGSSGAILSYIMCKGMNRSIFNVIAGGFGTVSKTEQTNNDNDDSKSKDNNIKEGNSEDAATILKKAKSVVIVPGYGMAVAQAQRSVQELYSKLNELGVSVKFAIHPVAGRMPGHMNVLLAEANIPYESVLEFDEINPEFSDTDVALVIGANDVTNPAAKTNKSSPIYGMPVFDVELAKTILFIKRSMAPGYSGIENELFYRNNTIMLFGDAKKVLDNVIKAI